MSHVIRTLVLLAACFLIAPSVLHAEDLTVAPEAARDIKAVAPDAKRAVKPALANDAAKIAPPASEISPPAGKALEPSSPAPGQIQQPEMKKPH